MSPQTVDELTRAYRAPGRFYHDLAHIQDCLRELEQALADGVPVDDPEALRYALWFHDYVYDPARQDNEEQSARAGKEAALRDGYSPAFADRVHALVMATKHGAVALRNNDEKLMVDIDLSSIAADDFGAITTKIRLEYAHVPDELFYPARKAVLRTFLEQPEIYHTGYFRRKYGDQAQANLQASVK